MHEPASLTCMRPSQLDAWPKATSGQHHWLRQAGCLATGLGPPIRLSSAGTVRQLRQGVNCTATGHLSSSGPFLHRAGVRRHIHASKPCFAASFGFKEIHVEARPSYVMAGAEGAAGPAPDVRHQPPDKTVNI